MDLPSDMPEAASTPDAPAVAHAGKCPACNGKLRAGAVICMNCGFNLAEGGKIKTRIETNRCGPRVPERHRRRTLQTRVGPHRR